LSNNNNNPFEIFEYVLKHDKDRLGKWLAVAQRWIDFYGEKKFERHWTAEDIIQEMIIKILGNVRAYDPNNYEDFDKFVYLTIRSIVENKVGSRKKIVPSEKIIQTKDGDEFINKYEKSYKTRPDQIMKDYEINEKLEYCYNKLMDDTEAALVFLEWKEGNTSKDIAEALGMSIKEVEAAKKRIRYRLTKNTN
jgi:RNA polymerase sigma factor (sigma-70 family)